MKISIASKPILFFVGVHSKRVNCSNSVPKIRTNMNLWNVTSSKILSQQVAYPPHLFAEETLNSSVIKRVRVEPRGAQLTIFYNGEVIVFDDIPAEKAKDIMSFATKGNSQSQNNYAYTSSAASGGPFPFHMNIFSSTANNSIQEHPQAPSKPVVCDLPMARKASLHRFLEKRKDRIAARSPYQTSTHMAALDKTAESVSWLALAPKSPQDESESSSNFLLF